jgi:hypothetical protein
MVGVTGQKGMLIPPWHLIPPLTKPGGSVSLYFIYLTGIRELCIICCLWIFTLMECLPPALNDKNHADFKLTSVSCV